MITRLVKLTFRLGEENNFSAIFENSKQKIRGFEGCVHLSVLQSKLEPSTFFTLSKWESDAHLESYRKSKLFKETWAKTKILFAKPAEAWTCEEEEVVPA